MSHKHSILVIEDEEPIRVGLVDVLVFHGFDVGAAADGRDGLHQALTGGFDLLLLDLMLPGLDGREICERVRARDPEQPIIMLTARGTDEDIIRGLKLGADDYVTKPFSVAELVLRVQAVLRRARPLAALPARFRLADGTDIDAANLTARRHGGPVAELTRREMETLQYLAAHAERPVPAEELLQQVWGYPKQANPETRTVAIHIAKLRRKLEPDRTEPALLLTVRGAGYRLLLVPAAPAPR
ncbi:response regulator transcription factor [Thiohalocapsa sp. ML1]|uniref:response regulator transcription factor n=1 Tax=Thiohalocapsa sp. ML1 TaxID=1431688 RepID=UPI0007323B6D|nr:response regulator transcription factor [Thiohalocapsa sp. ML1]